MPGTLYLIATPLGNPADLSARAAAMLRTVDILYAEDTRSARRLLDGLGIRRAVHSCFDANEVARATETAARLRAGDSVGLVSEAGTPAVSDPGYRLVRTAIAAGARVIPVPGPSALLAALVGSGLPTDRFLFAGFPPRKSSARRRWLEDLRGLDATLILFESPLRTGATLSDCLAVLGDRPACVARELTKTHEEFVRGPLSDLAARYRDDRPLGEITLVVGGASSMGGTADQATDDAVTVRARLLLGEGLSARDATRLLVTETGRSRSDVYRLVLAARAG